jgi:hypothetical protein
MRTVRIYAVAPKSVTDGIVFPAATKAFAVGTGLNTIALEINAPSKACSLW